MTVESGTSTPRTGPPGSPCTRAGRARASSCSATARAAGSAPPDLRAATAAALAAGLHVAQVDQPYRVAGRRAPAPAAQLDAAWLAVVAAVRPALPGLPLLVGGRSSGARVACRTASAADAVAVLCLAFPVHPPGRPEKDRLPNSPHRPSPCSSCRASATPSAAHRPPPAARSCSLRATTR